MKDVTSLSSLFPRGPKVISGHFWPFKNSKDSCKNLKSPSFNPYKCIIWNNPFHSVHFIAGSWKKKLLKLLQKYFLVVKNSPEIHLSERNSLLILASLRWAFGPHGAVWRRPRDEAPHFTQSQVLTVILCTDDFSDSWFSDLSASNCLKYFTSSSTSVSLL